MNRGPAVCANGRLVPRQRLERILVDAIFGQVFSPATVAYLTQRVNEAIARLTTSPDDQRRRRDAELARAQAELDNIRAAIRRGLATDVTREMLEEAERRVAALEHATIETPPNITALPAVVDRYLRELRQTMDTDVARARGLLATLVGEIPLRRRDGRLVAELRRNLTGLLELEDIGGDRWVKSGAGRGI